MQHRQKRVVTGEEQCRLCWENTWNELRKIISLNIKIQFIEALSGSRCNTEFTFPLNSWKSEHDIGGLNSTIRHYAAAVGVTKREGCRREGIKCSLLGQSSEERRLQPTFRWTDKNTLFQHFNSYPLMCGPRATFIITAMWPRCLSCRVAAALWKVQGSSRRGQTEPLNDWRRLARKRALCSECRRQPESLLHSRRLKSY